MSSDWPLMSLGDLVRLQRGHDLPVNEQRPGPYPVMGSAGPNGSHDVALAPGPGVVIGRSGASVGRVHYTSSAYWPHNTCLYVTDFLGNCPRFASYLLGSLHLGSFNSGSAQPSLNRNYIYSIPVRIPSRREQDEIAAVLSVLDERIALLRETNATLEAIAQALFKSWFVDFDPVRAKMKGRPPCGMDDVTAHLFPANLVHSEGGEVPEGWRRASLREAVSIHDSKRIPLSGQERRKRKGPFPYYGAAALMDFVDSYLFDGVYLLVGEDGSVVDQQGFPVTQYVWGKFWVNNHAHVLQGAGQVSTEHVMLAIKRTNIQPLITGAVQAKLSQASMWRIPFLMPSEPIASAFAAMVRPLFARVRHNTDQSKNLVSLRDTLLPRLISGKLRLPAAELLVGAVP